MVRVFTYAARTRFKPVAFSFSESPPNIEIGGCDMRRLSTTVLTAVLLSACGGVTGPEGVLVLRTVNGQDLPVSLRRGLCCRVHVITGSLQLHGDKTYDVTANTQVEAFGVLQPDTAVGNASGTYSINGSTIVFIDDHVLEAGDPRDFQYTGTVQGDQITSTNGPRGGFSLPLTDLVLVYSR